MNSLKWLRILLALAVLLTGAVPLRAASPHPSEGRNPGEEAHTYGAAAGVANLFHVPGKLVVCTVGGALGIAAAAITLGTRYDDAARFVKGACGGRWVIMAEDMKKVLNDSEKP